MIPNNNITLLRPSFYYGLLTLLALASIFFFILMPGWKETREIRDDIALLESKIQEQEALVPVYARLVQILGQDVAATPQYPAPGFFPEAQDMEGVMNALRQAANLSGLRTRSFSPDYRSLSKDSETFPVQCDLSGELPAFREFMLNLASGPNFTRLESMEIEHSTQGLRYRLRIIMSLS